MNRPFPAALLPLVLLLAGSTMGQDVASNGPSPTTTVSGATCQFPAIRNGQVVTECVDLGDGLYCQVEGGAWEVCGDGAAAAAPSSDNPPEKPLAPMGVPPSNHTLLSGDGTPCLTPIVLSGQPINDCVSLYEALYCWAEDGGWVQCGDPEPGSAAAAFGDIGTSVSFVVPTPTRNTVTGAGCALPFVDDNATVVADCVDRGAGVLECPVDDGSWQECEAPAPRDQGTAGTAGAAGLMYTPRQTVDGEECVLPFVEGSFINIICEPEEGKEGEGECLSAATGQLTPCAPVGLDAQEAPFDPDSDPWGSRTAPGGPGFPCSIIPRGVSSAEACQEGLSCFPMEALGFSAGYADFINLGFCGLTPPGGDFGIFPTLENAMAYQPLAFFPLLGEEGLRSFLIPQGNTSVEGLALEGGSPPFEGAPLCSQYANSLITVPSFDFPVSNGGAFTVNLWLALDPAAPPLNGTQWVFTYSLDGAMDDDPNKIQIFLEEGPPGQPPVLAAAVADANDGQGPSGLLYLVSEGVLYSDSSKSEVVGEVDIADGQWHMVTLSTAPPARDPSTDQEAWGGPGFRLFIDGRPTALISSQSKPEGLPEEEVPGGEVLDLPPGTPALLCTSPQQDPFRVLEGRVAQLLLFNRALTDEEVALLEGTYRESFPAAASAPSREAEQAK